MAELANGTPEDWGGRPAGGAGARDRGTSGAPSGTSGPRFGASGASDVIRAYLVIVALLSLVTFIDVMTILDDARRAGRALAPALPLVLEITSAVASLSACAIGYVALRLAPPSRRHVLRQIAVHLGASVVYSAIHIGLMTALRLVAFAAGHARYHWSFGDLPYEYRKDTLAYVVLTGVFWLLARPAPAEPTAAAPAGGPVTFDIQDGQAIFRAPVAEIVAAHAAGNYVEFLLADGRRPLMRTSLRGVEGTLAPAGFLRTHRSWLVNEARIRALVPAGSGDFRLELEGGVSAPLSRRYPDALAKARAGA